MTGVDRKQGIGLAALMVLGTIAGFLVAAGTSGADYATVDTIGDSSQAFGMPIEDDDQRVRFTLQADDGTATEPVAEFALYDPADEFFTQFELSGDGDEAEAILDRPGQWVLFLTDRDNAQLAVQYEGASEDADSVDLADLPVEEERTVVAEQDGGALDEQVALRLDRRPASIFMEYSGNIQGLDAEAASDEGVAYQLSDASANTTEDGTQRAGDATLTADNLVAGTYDVTARADAFDGKLVFVHETYERDDTHHVPDPGNNVDSDVEEPGYNGTIVAELTEGEARGIDTAGASQISFVATERDHAILRIFDSNNEFVEEVEIDHDHDYDWHWDEDDENDSREADPGVTVELPEPGTYTVYAVHADDEDEIQVIVPAEDAPQASELDVVETEKELEGDDAEWNTTIPGALLEVHAHSYSAASTERNVTVASELGPVLHYEQAFNMFGASMHYDYEVYPDRFIDGEISVTVDGDGFGSSTEVKLVHLAS